MNSDLLPINAFAQESCAAADALAGVAHTLTMKLALGPVPAGQEPMFGVASAGLAAAPNAAALHAAVLHASVVAVTAGAITITF